MKRLLLISLQAFALALPAQAAPEATTARLESLRNLSTQAPKHRVLDIQSWRTAEGAKVLFVESHQLPMLDIRLTFAAGSARDGQAYGLATLTNAMLNEGIPNRDVTAIAMGFEQLGAVFANGAYRDMAVVSLRSLSDPQIREPAIDLFKRVLGEPSFPEDSLQRIKNQLLSGFEYQKQQPARIANKALMAALYGDHPYAHPSDGTPESIPGITRTQLVDFHQQAYAAGNSVIALVGDIDRTTAESIAAGISSTLPKGPALPAVATPAPPTPRMAHVDFPSNQSHILLGELGITRRDPDWPALYLGNQILGGGGFGTRLMEEVREKRGLTYGIYSGFTPMQAPGPFNISVQTRADMQDGTLDLVKKLFAEYLQNGPTEKELNDAKRESAGSLPLATANNGDIIDQLGAIGFYDLPLTYLEDFSSQVQNLSTAQVKTAMAKHLAVERLIGVSVGPQVEQKPLPPPSRQNQPLPSGVPEH